MAEPSYNLLLPKQHVCDWKIPGSCDFSMLECVNRYSCPHGWRTVLFTLHLIIHLYSTKILNVTSAYGDCGGAIVDRRLEYAWNVATVHKNCFVLFADKNFISGGPKKCDIVVSFSLGIWNIFKGEVENDISKLLAFYPSISFNVTQGRSCALHTNSLKLKSRKAQLFSRFLLLGFKPTRRLISLSSVLKLKEDTSAVSNIVDAISNVYIVTEQPAWSEWFWNVFKNK